MAIRKRITRKEESKEITNNEPVSEDIFAQYQNERSKKAEGIILRQKK